MKDERPAGLATCRQNLFDSGSRYIAGRPLALVPKEINPCFCTVYAPTVTDGTQTPKRKRGIGLGSLIDPRWIWAPTPQKGAYPPGGVMGSRRSAISARPEGARCHTGNNLVGSAGTLLIDLSAEDGGPRASKSPANSTLCGHRCGHDLMPKGLIACKSLKTLVGARRFELRTSCSRSRRATRLRYAPNGHAEKRGEQLPLQCRVAPGGCQRRGAWANRGHSR